MKTRIISLACCLFIVACSPDLMDVNSVSENNRQQIQMQVDVRISGTIISTRSAATAAERTVDSYDIYIFDVASGVLQYYERNIVPADAEPIPSTKNYRIGKHDIQLETSGQKYVFVLANAASGVSLPEPVTEDEATEETGATRLDDFRGAVVQTLSAGTRPSSPFVMSGYTFIASSADATVPVTLGRTVAKVSVYNTQPGQISLSEVLVTGVSEQVYPFAESAPGNIGIIDYDPLTQFSTGNPALSVYMFPAPASQTAITVKGTLNGIDFTCEVPFTDRIYADYDYSVSLSVKAGKVVAEFSGGTGGGAGGIAPIELSGEWLSGKAAVTLPFTPEPNYGFSVGYTLNVEGPASIVKPGAEDWYDAEIVGEGSIRIRTLKENTGSERSADFDINAGGETLQVKVTQQGLADISTVSFGSMEWMDRPIGATLRSSQAFANDVRSFGYLYQWGRTLPFPVTGAVETVTTQMTPTEALSGNKFIAYTGETQDWNSQGVEGGFTSYWETVTANPCPSGWRLPTYEEIAEVMLYRNNSLIFAAGKQTAPEQFPNNVTHDYVGYGSGAITENASLMCHYGIKRQGTADAYYVRYQWINMGGSQTTTPPSYSATHSADGQNYMTGGQNILRIDRIKANASANFSSQAEAKTFWADNETTSMETLVFPCGGRRDATGTAVETNNAAFYWSRSMFTGGSNTYSKTSSVYASGLLYFRPAGRYVFMFAPAIGTAQVQANTEDLGYRNQAMQIRCVKGN